MKLVVTGAAGLVGQNLVLLAREAGYRDIVAIDKHARNLAVAGAASSRVRTVVADLAAEGDWTRELRLAPTVVGRAARADHGQGPARLSCATTSMRRASVFAAIAAAQVPFLVHVSSSVVNSVADDDYTSTKKAQERLVVDSGIRRAACCGRR